MPMFKIKDLMINVTDSRLKLRGGTALCTIDQPTTLVCTVHSPFMAVARLSDQLELMGKLAQVGTAEAVEDLKVVSRNVADALVAGAIQGGGRMMPDPNCGGTSYETIPTPITPVVSQGEVIRVSDLPALKERMAQVSRTVERLEAQFEPANDLEREVVAEHLKAGLQALSSARK